MKWSNFTVSSSTIRMSKLLKNLHHSTEDDYRKAVFTLNLLQSNAQDSKSHQSTEFLHGKLGRFRSFLARCGVEIRQLEDQLSVIHVSGTKGKGSTCAYCECILQNYGLKTGFYSSPHLVSVRERIRVNGEPISAKQFANCFWDVHNKLKNRQNENAYDDMPPYFMFLTIMAFKIFIEEKVDVAIIEVGIGGEYDYTNIVSNTAVVGISSLGFDHVKILGNTMEEIAFQKSGIMKPGCVAVSSPNQPAAALKVLQERAVQKKCTFFVAPALNEYTHSATDFRLGIKGLAQEYNASLAVQLVNVWLNLRLSGVYQESAFSLSKEMLEGLENCCWPGRAQLLTYSTVLTYYLDGAHTLESMNNCVLWYQNTAPASVPSCKRVLVFNMTDSRCPTPLMELLIPLKFDYVFFCPNRVTSMNEDLSQDNTDLHTSPDEDYDRIVGYREEWNQLVGRYEEKSVKLFYNVRSVHEFLEQLSSKNELHVLITGSLHLVGTFLTILDPELKNSYNKS